MLVRIPDREKKSLKFGDLNSGDVFRSSSLLYGVLYFVLQTPEGDRLAAPLGNGLVQKIHYNVKVERVIGCFNEEEY